jgi:hypothetical protein
LLKKRLAAENRRGGLAVAARHAITVKSPIFRHLWPFTCVNCVAGRNAGLWQHRTVEFARGPATMQSVTEISIDLTAQELTDPPTVAPIEVDDICEFDPLLNPNTAANTDASREPGADDDTIEIELTADQMDAMLCAQPGG